MHPPTSRKASLNASLYPGLEPSNTGELRVSSLHTLYYEESGRPDGMPVVVVHGGPGGGSEPTQRRFFNPDRYRIVLFDQRGCGRSTPHAELRENTTWDLVADMERLRAHLGVDRWQVFGGSWGSALALAYAQSHPDRVTELVLRGIFLLREAELRWFYQTGTSEIFPDAWKDYIAPIPESERGDIMQAYYTRLTSPDATVRLKAARAWSTWEGRTVSLLPDPKREAEFSTNTFAEAFARIECHYFVHGGWFEPRDQILRNVDRIRHIPAVIVQGRYDVVTPMTTAWDLHRVWPEADFRIIDDAGHASTEPGIARALVAATDRFAA